MRRSRSQPPSHAKRLMPPPVNPGIERVLSGERARDGSGTDVVARLSETGRHRMPGANRRMAGIIALVRLGRYALDTPGASRGLWPAYYRRTPAATHRRFGHAFRVAFRVADRVV